MCKFMDDFDAQTAECWLAYIKCKASESRGEMIKTVIMEDINAPI